MVKVLTPLEEAALAKLSHEPKTPAVMGYPASVYTVLKKMGYCVAGPLSPGVVGGFSPTFVLEA